MKSFLAILVIGLLMTPFVYALMNIHYEGNGCHWKPGGMICRDLHTLHRLNHQIKHHRIGTLS